MELNYLDQSAGSGPPDPSPGPDGGNWVLGELIYQRDVADDAARGNNGIRLGVYDGSRGRPQLLHPVDHVAAHGAPLAAWKHEDLPRHLLPAAAVARLRHAPCDGVHAPIEAHRLGAHEGLGLGPAAHHLPATEYHLE